ncbi:MAG: SGNH/GDSL hydrolase family protein [Victivallales bacterium]|nr:SGNH/GDSL hydrolase family protein [Victivallales bacterium]
MERIKAILAGEAPARWLFYGDSITHGAKHTLGMRDFSELFRERVLWEMRRQSDLVLNSAYSGFTCEALLRDFDWRAKAFAPTVSLVMIGTNDSTRVTPDVFRRQLCELVEKFDAIHTLTVLQTPLPVLLNLDAKRSSVPELAQVVRDVALEYRLPLIDHFKSWSDDPAKFYLHADALHPNAQGHIKIAHDIFRAFGIFDEDSWVCKLFAPNAL